MKISKSFVDGDKTNKLVVGWQDFNEFTILVKSLWRGSKLQASNEPNFKS